MEDETFIEEESHFSIDIAEQKYLKNISFSGGGFKGLAFLGCVKALHEREVLHNVKSYAGSSVGALIATLVVCGADYTYLREVSVGACQFFSNFRLDLLSLITRSHVNRFGTSFGVYKTEDLRNYIRTCLQNVLNIDHDITFAELYVRNPVDLIVTASCLETQTPFYFSHLTTKDTPVSEAVSISCSIPLLFGKNVYEDKTLVDGCLIEKLPMQCWPQEEIEYTMAFLIKTNRENTIRTNTFSDYIHAIESTMEVNIHDTYLSKYKNAITVINSGSIVTHGKVPVPEEISKVIYAAYFQTLSELSRRNFIDEFSVPKSQEISSLILSDALPYPNITSDKSLIQVLVVILLVVTILKIAFL